jgi:hypothetical protein
MRDCDDCGATGQGYSLVCGLGWRWVCDDCLAWYQDCGLHDDAHAELAAEKEQQNG